MKKLIVLCFFVFPLSVSADIEIPRTEAEFIERAILSSIEDVNVNPDVFLAIAKAESGLSMTAKNYNCVYNGKSTSCAKSDRHLAWSVDCGPLQLNFRGLHCPKEAMTLDTHLDLALGRFKAQGLRAWSAYNNKSYMKYLPTIALGGS